MHKTARIFLPLACVGLALAAKLTCESYLVRQSPLRITSTAAERFVPTALRQILADIAWLKVTSAWQQRAWPQVEKHANRALWLRPEAPLFFELTGWHLGWNAALDVAQNLQAGTLSERRARAAHYIGAGRRAFLEGIAHHPNHWPLYQLLAMLEGQCAGNWHAAATWYERSACVSRAPGFLLRLAADAHEKAGDWKRAVTLWKSALESSTNPQQRAQLKRRLEHASALAHKGA